MSGPVKVYVGTDPNMKKAELALEYSIRKHTSSDVDIIWMDYSRGGVWDGWDIGRERGHPYAKKGWGTDFTCFRFAIPEVAGFQGRAIYLDVDMILLKDIRELFETKMDKPVLSTPGGFDVILYDCTAFKDKLWWPTVERMKVNKWRRQDYEAVLKNHDFCGGLDEKWDCRDGKGYDENTTALVHYTNMNTQPWKPYPQIFKYPPHPRQDMVDLFWKYYEEAQKNG